MVQLANSKVQCFAL